jgi:hypothetical protein
MLIRFTEHRTTAIGNIPDGKNANTFNGRGPYHHPGIACQFLQ